MLPQRRSTTISFETYAPYSLISLLGVGFAFDLALKSNYISRRETTGRNGIILV